MYLFYHLICHFSRGIRDDIDGEDEEEAYYRYMEENPTAGLINDEEDIYDYDSDGNPIAKIGESKKVFSLLC